MDDYKDFPADHVHRGTQTSPVGRETDNHAANGVPNPKDAVRRGADVEQGVGQRSGGEAQSSRACALLDPTLALAADVLDDLESTRLANENRLRQLTRSAEDADGEIRGFGLDESHPDVARLAGIVDGLARLDHEAELNLKRTLRKHPLGAWVKATKGVGERQAARLLAAIGDPYWNTLHDRPRTVSELWAYCGLHVLPVGQTDGDSHRRSAGGDAPSGGGDAHRPFDIHSGSGVAPARTRGVRTNWNNTAKMRAYLVAISCMKTRNSPYRVIYDEGRAKYADATHTVECRRCGPSGKPAQPGTPISAGHQHARALRLVMKAVLRDLWLEAKHIHETGEIR